MGNADLKRTDEKIIRSKPVNNIRIFGIENLIKLENSKFNVTNPKIYDDRPKGYY